MTVSCCSELNCNKKLYGFLSLPPPLSLAMNSNEKHELWFWGSKSGLQSATTLRNIFITHLR